MYKKKHFTFHYYWGGFLSGGFCPVPQIYTIGLNTSFTTYMKFSPVSYIHRSDR